MASKTPQPTTSILGKYLQPKKGFSKCGNPSHTVDTCYQVHGYPTNYKFKKKNVAGAHNIQTNGSSRDDSRVVPQEASPMVFTPAQFSQLVALLQTPKPTTNQISISSLVDSTNNNSESPRR